jgi:predicted small lipoprotein YifL
MKNTLKIMLLLLALATLGSCVKEPVKRRNIAPNQN